MPMAATGQQRHELHWLVAGGGTIQEREVANLKPFATFDAKSADSTGPFSMLITRAASFDHLVGARKHRRRYFKTKHFRRFEIDDQLELGRRLHRQVGRLLALENAVDIAGRASV